MTKSPPATNDSLFARATLLPAFNAESVGPNPIAPVMPFNTMSQGSAAISFEELAPSIIFTPAVSAAGAIVPTIGTPNFLACCINKSGFFRPALNPTTLKVSGLAATISNA